MGLSCGEKRNMVPACVSIQCVCVCGLVCVTWGHGWDSDAGGKGQAM